MKKGWRGEGRVREGGREEWIESTCVCCDTAVDSNARLVRPLTLPDPDDQRLMGTDASAAVSSTCMEPKNENITKIIWWHYAKNESPKFKSEELSYLANLMSSTIQ